MINEKWKAGRLRAEDYGLYLRNPRKMGRDKHFTVAEIGTDWIKLPYYLICGVPIDLSFDPLIYVVNGQPKLTNVESTLINGTRVCTFDAEIIQRLWKFGSPVDIRIFPTEETLKRYRHAQEQWSFGKKALYELPIRKKVYS